MRQNNKGLSLVELIVVIAIMAVVIGIGTVSFQLLFGTQAKACAQKFSGMLNETKTGCMSRYDETMVLSWRKRLPSTDPAYEPAIISDGYYTENTIYTIKKDATPIEAGDTEFRKMGGGRVVIKVYMTGVPVFELAEGNSITISFDRASGAFDKAEAVVNGSIYTGYIEKMTFQSGLRTFTIEMVQETGKHTLQG